MFISTYFLFIYIYFVLFTFYFFILLSVLLLYWKLRPSQFFHIPQLRCILNMTRLSLSRCCIRKKKIKCEETEIRTPGSYRSRILCWTGDNLSQCALSNELASLHLKYTKVHMWANTAEAHQGTEIELNTVKIHLTKYTKYPLSHEYKHKNIFVFTRCNCDKKQCGHPPGDVQNIHIQNYTSICMKIFM